MPLHVHICYCMQSCVFLLPAMSLYTCYQNNSVSSKVNIVCVQHADHRRCVCGFKFRNEIGFEWECAENFIG